MRSKGEQTAAADELKVLAEHLDRVQAASNTGSWEWDIRRRRLVWSGQIFRILGLEPGAIEPDYSAFLERVHPDDRAQVDLAMRRTLCGEGACTIHHRIVRPDGVVRTVRLLAELERAEDGEPARMTGVSCDVTEQLESEVARRRSQEMMASLFRISPEAIVVTDEDGTIQLFSHGAEAVFGYSASELAGRAVEDLMPHEAREAHRHHVKDFAARDAEALRMHERGNIQGRRKNGEVFPAEASLAKLSTSSGVYFAAIVRDLSETRAAEQRLVEAREQAERANTAKSSFLANMSHEIRTPLNGILGVASALARTSLMARQKEMVQLIETSGRALQGLLGDILDLAKVDAGHLQIRCEAFDLGATVRGTLALFRASAAEKGVVLNLQIDPAVDDWFEGDDLRIRQVLSNLLSNAVKFTQSGEITLSMSLAGDLHERIVRFAVRDTGIGFDAEVAERLFDRFEQADGSITRRFGGTGLGLAISKALVELMDGSIEARSEPGVGSTFAFELPLRPATPAAPEPIGEVQAAELAGPRISVLLAEDHPINRMTVQMILDDLPVDLVCVENGRDAVAAARAKAFDLIFMDMQMPVMDGLTAIRAIRRAEAVEPRPRSQICVLTANAMIEHRQAALEAGADDLLTKPISAGELIDYVATAGGRRERPPVRPVAGGA